MKILLLLFFFSLISTAICNDDIDSLLTLQRERGGEYTDKMFNCIEKAHNKGLTEDEVSDLKFLAAYLPLADLASLTIEELIENVRLARVAKNRFTWGEYVPSDIYNHFVLPHRISQEPFVSGWREEFLDELTLRVENLDLYQAALEVNHWVNEKATFKRTSGRDQDPLTTVRSGFGRCEEGMILTIAAFRSVGIPARQCYTPYWAHCDNNHAWVEVWVDGKWEYLGGGEPKPALSEAWFTKSAGRAMLVVSTAYGAYAGEELTLRDYGRSTSLNSTPVYGTTRNVKVNVRDAEAIPMPSQKVIFSLFNYGTFMPILVLYTDSLGNCNTDCGMGSWMISSGKDGKSALVFNPDTTNSVNLLLNDSTGLTGLTEVDYFPPPSPESVGTTEFDSIFKARLEFEKLQHDSHFWNLWDENESGNSDSSYVGMPGQISAEKIESILSQKTELDSNEVLDILLKSRGNWGHIYFFLTGNYPHERRGSAIQAHVSNNLSELYKRWKFINTLSDKDLRDFSISILEDHYQYSTIFQSLRDANAIEFLEEMSSEVYERYMDFVIKPRISREPSVSWRAELTRFLEDNPKLVESKDDRLIIDWIIANITLEKDRDRLGSGMPPNWTLRLKRGAIHDIEVLYIGLCRIRGIPARFNPVNNALERWEKDEWTSVRIINETEDDISAFEFGLLVIKVADSDSIQEVNREDQLTESPEDWHSISEEKLKKVLYLKDWSVAEWKEDHFSVVDFGYQKPFGEIEWPQKLPVGLYCLASGIREKDGSVPVSLSWFRISKGIETTVDLSFRPGIED